LAVDHEAMRQEISEALGSIGRIRMLAELARKPGESLSKHNLEAATGIKRKDIKSSLERLMTIGWVREHKSLHPRYQINLENERTRLFVEFLEKSGFL
jgi:hypothetical protein